MNLLPYTPDIMRSFNQEIVVDIAALLRSGVKKQMIAKLPTLVNEGKELSYLAAFEALRNFRNVAQAQKTKLSDAEKNQLAQIEVDWCLDVLNRLQRAGKIEE
jgi:hypothetical protein